MITVAKNAGFCFGVRRATDTVEKLIDEKRENEIICTQGKLIHNEEYNKFLSEKGVVELTDSNIESVLDKAKKGVFVTIVIRTHGIERHVEEKLEAIKKEAPSLKIVDLTCPYVKKIHEIAKKNSSENEIFFVIGQREHPEVKSIVSNVSGECHVFASDIELEDYLKSNKVEKAINMSAQTTLKLSLWEKCQKILKNYCTNVKIFDTICSVTETRQREAEELSKKSDAMLVIGGRESSNTSKLVQVCKTYCDKTFWIQTSNDIDLEKIGDAKYIGITAGASTPDSLIKEVKETMSEVKEASFAELFALECENGAKVKIYTGATVKGTVMSISENEIRLDLGAKVTGVVTRDQITDSNDVKLADLFKIGDEIEASVISVSDRDGIAILSKKKVDVVKNWSKIVEYQASGETVNAKITEATKGGLVALIDDVRVFIPASMTGVAKDGDMSALVGTTQEVKVVEIKDDKKKAIASIKAILREKKKAEKEAFWASIEEGMVFEGTVKSIASYGAFVDLGAVDGLVHITELSWKRIKNPSEVVSVGDKIKVFVKSVDKENGKISLGHKTDDENPWNIFKSKYQEGDVCEVKIVGVTTFGAFAQVVPGVDGLIHISQIADKKIDSVAEILKVGETIEVKIVGIDDEKKKVSLSARALLPEAEPVEEVAVEAAEETAEEAVAEEAAAEATEE
ncbi:MAG: bifunctional 4-hydroxy-3-methylbut-2-enyl diphosphate reductase/30S ribosomal protein S1 [Clostridia bacterium]|nr:bifunctional 4-hydroxy-3-methylbut-2-enyl diphosphate reductase/30S ribosomal protein S1 [Clostridia bacterium]